MLTKYVPKHLKHLWLCLTDGYTLQYNHNWDTLLKDMINNGRATLQPSAVEFEYLDHRYNVWTCNKYENYGFLNAEDGRSTFLEKKFRPSFRTMLRLEKLVKGLEKLEVDKLRGESYE